MTTTGFGDMYAVSDIARIFVTTQMILSAVFVSVICGLGLRKMAGDRIAESRNASILISQHASRQNSRCISDAEPLGQSFVDAAEEKESIPYYCRNSANPSLQVDFY